MSGAVEDCAEVRRIATKHAPAQIASVTGWQYRRLPPFRDPHLRTFRRTSWGGWPLWIGDDDRLATFEEAMLLDSREVRGAPRPGDVIFCSVGWERLPCIGYADDQGRKHITHRLGCPHTT